MNRMITISVGLLVLIFIGSPLVMGGQMPMGGQGGQQEQPSGQQPMMGRGMMGMMCPMMSGMSGGQMDPSGMMSMMGMMGGGEMDPKTMGRMLEFRGELLKAMGDVMIKHGQAMRKEP
jgi:hypothetical protein